MCVDAICISHSTLDKAFVEEWKKNPTQLLLLDGGRKSSMKRGGGFPQRCILQIENNIRIIKTAETLAWDAIRMVSKIFTGCSRLKEIVIALKQSILYLSIVEPNMYLGKKLCWKLEGKSKLSQSSEPRTSGKLIHSLTTVSKKHDC